MNYSILSGKHRGEYSTSTSQSCTMPSPSTSVPYPTILIANLLSQLSHPSPTSHEATETLPRNEPIFEKPYLLTLHALFPTTLLPALDLLDRRLITRLELSETQSNVATQLENNDKSGSTNARQQASPGGDGGIEFPQLEARVEGVQASAAAAAGSAAVATSTRQANSFADPIGNQHKTKHNQNRVYYVRSSQPSSSSTRYSRSSRRSRAWQHGLEGKSYEVRTLAWSCSCAAFAFAAFSHAYRRHAAEGGGLGGNADGDGRGYGDDGADNQHVWYEEEEGGDGKGEERNEDVGVDEGGRVNWGGLMASYGQGLKAGRDESRHHAPLPLCKHLLACVLAEWWGEAGELVERRRVEKGELGGWAAG